MPFDPYSALSDLQKSQLAQYEALLWDVNQQINVVSRKMAAGEFAERHLLHCLALTLYDFPKKARVVDWGTGGGLPGLVLAICFPEVTFHLVDSTTKKIRAVQEMAEKLGLANVITHPIRAESFAEKVHFAVSRATAPLVDLWSWYRPVRAATFTPQNCWQADLVCLKGGNLTEEIAQFKRKFPRTEIETIDLFELLERDFFKEKVILTVKSTA